MAPVQQLIAIAFVLCGVLFLLHVDSVNSLQCKRCRSEDSRCESGRVDSVFCPNNYNYCITIRLFANAKQGIIRDCYSYPSVGCRPVQINGTDYISCTITCSWDNCNDTQA